MIPPPVPYCQAVSWTVKSPVGAPRARVKRENWRRKLTMVDNMLTVGFLFDMFDGGLMEVCKCLNVVDGMWLYLKMGKQESA